MTLWRTLCLAALVSPLAQAGPLPGKWEQRFTAWMFDGTSYQPWEEPKQVRCLSASDIRDMPLLGSPSNMAALKQEYGTCTAPDTKPETGGTSWTTTCKDPPKTTTIQARATERDIHIVVRTQGDVGVFGPEGMKVEFRHARLGECDGAAPKK